MSGLPTATTTEATNPGVTNDPWLKVFPHQPASTYHHRAMNDMPDRVNKIGVMADYVAAIYHQYTAALATQLIYCETVVVYHEIRRQLAARGIPEAEIAFIQDHQSKTKKSKLFADLNAGRVRVLLASKQSTGMNIQKRLIALHHVDCPWRPGDLEQRVGRIVRQGNAFPEVLVFAFVTEGSFDGYRWQTIETKTGFIEQVKRGDVSMREMDDLGDNAASAAEIKALASGNPLVLEKVKLDSEIQKLEVSEASDRESRVRLRTTIRTNESERQRLTARIPFLEAVKVSAAQSRGLEFKAAILNGVMTTEATAYTKRDAAGEALFKVLAEIDAQTQALRMRQVITVGRYRSVDIRVSASIMGDPQIDLLFDGYRNEQRVFVPIVLKTAAGAFQTMDYALNHVQDEVDRIAKTMGDLSTSDQTCATILSQPWPHVEVLATMKARVETVNRQLAGTPETDESAETDADGTAVTDAAETDAPAPAAAPATLQVTSESHADHVARESAVVMVRPVVMLPAPTNREAMDAAIRLLSGQDAPAEESVEELSAEPIAAATAEVATIEAVAPTPDEMLDMPPATLEIPARPAKVPALVFGARVSTTTTKKAKPAPTHAVRTMRMADVLQMDLFGGEIAHAAMAHTDSGPAQISMF